ncbi:MAG: NifU N-terminal domain-containing protein [Ardenticatenaceae bacterium]|nr:NifU N-terminal domain-containing protein [Anaerolineales bacterium]MCB8920578.1 NifU N-terminal domain-containing protein [Ardenticatenaceae bacterium]MCB8990203.1 NifU N-terminal domain-containing protein [Ardenticatenaceae bacterium]MCB9003006.1 NifU N-terminal domain-containing protein [Ardenticatenaceae bacterium]
MSEYIEIETELSDDGQRMTFYTNLTLSDQGHEAYASPDEMEEGSPLAHALAVIPGIAHLTLDDSDLIIRKDPDADWYAIIADISAAIKDFFL